MVVQSVTPGMYSCTNPGWLRTHAARGLSSDCARAFWRSVKLTSPASYRAPRRPWSNSMRTTAPSSPVWSVSSVNPTAALTVPSLTASTTSPPASPEETMATSLWALVAKNITSSCDAPDFVLRSAASAAVVVVDVSVDVVSVMSVPWTATPLISMLYLNVRGLLTSWLLLVSVPTTNGAFGAWSVLASVDDSPWTRTQSAPFSMIRHRFVIAGADVLVPGSPESVRPTPSHAAPKRKALRFLRPVGSGQT